MKTLAKISESILDQGQIEQETDFNLEMNKLFRWYFDRDDNDPSKLKCEYGLKNGMLHIKSWGCAPRLDNDFLKAVKKYGVKKLVWNVCGCTPRLYGNWWLDTEIVNGHICICTKEFSANLKCSGFVSVDSSCVFRNAKITTQNMVRFKHGQPQQFLGSTKFIGCPEAQMYGEYMNQNKWEDSIFVDKLIKLKVVEDGYYGRVSFIASKTHPDITITDIIGKNWPDVNQVWIHRLSNNYTIYICKDSAYDKEKLHGCYSIEQYPIKGGWTIYYGYAR